uniref:RBR-type E3 ubiquitin transferase n=1 Tax=Arabidopsis thaliana TaxID=3702 RepID=Q1PEI0_ARATH|nr:zinc finger family protein [Arabidopsis thaliana]
MAPNPTGKPSPDGSSSDSYNLYFKGSLAGFGVAIYREEDDSILFKKKVSLHYPDFTAWEAELMALKLGLTKAVSFRINHISMFFDNPEIFELVMGRSVPKDKKIALIMDEVQRIRQQFSSSIPFLVASNEIKFVYKLAKETLVSNISIPRPQKKTCGNCFNDGIKGENMFSADLCSHYFCVECMKEHIEVSLNEGGLPRCPHDGCTSNLTLRSCDHLLTPKQREMWEKRIKEESIPVCDRFHCPNPRCWALMSNTELTESTEEDGVRRCCYKCRKHFCINCKVPWHSNLSCKEHKSSGREPITTVWRQCRSCLHKIKLSEERMPVTCRCGYKFCYACGAQWKLGGCCSHHLQEVMDWVAIVLIFLAFVSLLVVSFMLIVKYS